MPTFKATTRGVINEPYRVYEEGDDVTLDCEVDDEGYALNPNGRRVRWLAPKAVYRPEAEKPIQANLAPVKQNDTVPDINDPMYTESMKGIEEKEAARSPAVLGKPTPSHPGASPSVDVVKVVDMGSLPVPESKADTGTGDQNVLG